MNVSLKKLHDLNESSRTCLSCGRGVAGAEKEISIVLGGHYRSGQEICADKQFVVFMGTDERTGTGIFIVEKLKLSRWQKKRISEIPMEDEAFIRHVEAFFHEQREEMRLELQEIFTEEGTQYAILRFSDGGQVGQKEKQLSQ